MTSNPLRVRLADERGWMLVTSMVLMSIMLLIGLSSISLVDTQQKRTREQRAFESGLNLSEAALYTRGFKLAQRWPTQQFPAVDCSSTVASASCPVPAEVLKNVNNVDTKAATSWTTMIRDNGGDLRLAFQPAYANAGQSGTDVLGKSYACPGPCNYDANGDRRVWVQAKAMVRGRPRTVVATLKLERLPESTPQSAVVAGGINVGNSGSQKKIYAVGSNVVVRCNPNTGVKRDDERCVSDQNGIEPRATAGNPGDLMMPTQIQRFRNRAIADQTYHDCAKSGEPAMWDFSGEVRFYENCVTPSLTSAKLVTKPCVDPLPAEPSGSGGNGLQAPCINTYAKPGLMIFNCGQLDVSGKATFIGLLYFPNGSDGSCARRGSSPPDCSSSNKEPDDVFFTSGGFGVWGAVAIDGNGCLHASANGLQVYFDRNVFNAVASYGAVGLVQDTWRELTPG